MRGIGNKENVLFRFICSHIRGPSLVLIKLLQVNRAKYHEIPAAELKSNFWKGGLDRRVPAE